MTGRAALLAGNGCLFLWLALRMPPEEYGRVFQGVGAQLLLSRVILSGVDTGLIRLSAGKTAVGDPWIWSRAALCVVGAVTAILLGAAALIASAGLVSISATAAVLAGSLGCALIDLEYSRRISSLDPHAAGRYLMTLAASRLAIVVVTAEVAGGNVIAILVAYAAPGLLAGSRAAVRVLSRCPAPQPSLALRLVRYSLPQGFANFAALLNFYQGAFMLTAMGSHAAGGEFSFALTLSMGALAVVQGYSEHLLPRAARLTGAGELAAFVRRSFAVAAAVLAMALPLGILVGSLVYALVKPNFHPLVFYLLLSCMLGLLLQSSFHAAAHFLLAPRIILIGWVVRIVGMLVAALALQSDTALSMGYAQCFGAAAALASTGAILWIEVHARNVRRAVA